MFKEFQKYHKYILFILEKFELSHHILQILLI